MSPRQAQRGTTLVEYAALVVVMVTLIGTLTVLRPHRVGHVPLDPVKAVGLVLAPPPRPVVRRPRATPPHPAARRTRASRPRARRPIAQVPTWVTGPR